MSVDSAKLQSLRRRRGLTQQDLADLSGVSKSTIRELEQGIRTSVRLETLRKLATALKVRTTTLRVTRDAEEADPETDDLWGPVRRALAGQLEEADEPATSAGVREAFEALGPLIDNHLYAEIAAALPQLLRDADTLTDIQGRAVRSRLLSTTGWMLTQNRQFDLAEATLDRAIDTAADRGTALVAVNILVWAHSRQGQLATARDLAIRWADDSEPRFSRATTAQLALWGRLWLHVANLAVRDNAPGETEDALSLARAAADRIGHELVYDPYPNRTFGPVTVAQITGECAVIAEKPDHTLAIADGIPEQVLAPTAAGRLRHRLDVANAHSQLRQYPEAMTVLEQLRAQAPQWLRQQRYARDILGGIISKRRTLTTEMRSMADEIKVAY